MFQCSWKSVYQHQLNLLCGRSVGFRRTNSKSPVRLPGRCVLPVDGLLRECRDWEDWRGDSKEENVVRTQQTLLLKLGFHIIVFGVKIVSVAEIFVKRSWRLSLVSIHSSLMEGSSLSQNVLSCNRVSHMETLLRLFQTILTSEANRSSR